MIIQKTYKYISIFFLALAPLFCSVHARVETEKTIVDWVKSTYINDPLAFENFWCISADIDGNLWVLTHTPDGQIFLSVNGHKIWWNKNADPEAKEPTALIAFSAGCVKKVNISYDANSILPHVTIEGTVYGILAPDHAKKPKEKYLYKLVKGDFGYSWKKEESLAQKAEMVSACNDGSVVVMTSDGPYQKIGDGAWNKLGAVKGLKQIAAANKDTIFALSEKNAALTWKDGAWELLESGKQKDNIRHMAANDKGVLYCTDKHGKAFYFSDKKGWIALPKIFNAQQIAVSPKKYFCWTSEPYGNALLKNHVSFIDKKITALLAGGGMAILGTGAVGGVVGGVGVVGVGAAVATMATVIAPLTKKTISSATPLLKSAQGNIGHDEAYVSYSKFFGNLATGGLVPVLALGAVGIVAVEAVPVIIINAAVASVLFGAGAAIVLMILSRPHNNEIYECEDILESDQV